MEEPAQVPMHVAFARELASFHLGFVFPILRHLTIIAPVVLYGFVD